MADSRERKTDPNRSALRSARILKLLGEATIPLGVTQISQELGISAPTAYRLLLGLQMEGLIDQDPETHKYGISVELYALGRVAFNYLGFGERVTAELRALSERVGETTNLGVVRGTRVIYLQCIESKQALRTTVKVGSNLPAHATAIGKAVLAHASPEEFDAYLEQVPLQPYARGSIVDPMELRHRLELIRIHGYTFDDEECHRGVRAVGAPVFRGSGEVIAGLAITGPTARLEDDIVPSIVREIVETAKRVSRLAGYYDEKGSVLSSLQRVEQGLDAMGLGRD